MRVWPADVYVCDKAGKVLLIDCVLESRYENPWGFNVGFIVVESCDHMHSSCDHSVVNIFLNHEYEHQRCIV